MINNNSILLIDPAFEPSAVANCVLLVKVSLDSFSYAILNEETNKVIAVFDEQECEDGALTFADRIKTDSYLSLPYKTIKIAAYTPNSISIPNDLYEVEDLGKNAQFFPEPHSENLYTYKEDNLQFTTIFAFEKGMEETFNLNNANLYPENAGLLALTKNTGSDSIILDFRVNSFNALYINNDKLIFQQSYQFDNVEEFNYYLLLMINQLKISNEISVYLSGIIDHNDEKYTCLQKYFNEIDFLTVGHLNNQEVLDDMPAYYYSSLLALSLCE